MPACHMLRVDMHMSDVAQTNRTLATALAIGIVPHSTPTHSGSHMNARCSVGGRSVKSRASDTSLRLLFLQHQHQQQLRTGGAQRRRPTDADDRLDGPRWRAPRRLTPDQQPAAIAGCALRCRCSLVCSASSSLVLVRPLLTRCASSWHAWGGGTRGRPYDLVRKLMRSEVGESCCWLRRH